jgi:hypothetical protein
MYHQKDFLLTGYFCRFCGQYIGETANKNIENVDCCKERATLKRIRKKSNEKKSIH